MAETEEAIGGGIEPGCEAEQSLLIAEDRGKKTLESDLPGLWPRHFMSSPRPEGLGMPGPVGQVCLALWARYAGKTSKALFRKEAPPVRDPLNPTRKSTV